MTTVDYAALPKALRDHARDCEMLDMPEGRPNLIRSAADRIEALEKASGPLLALLDNYMVVSSLTANDRYEAALTNFRSTLSGEREE